MPLITVTISTYASPNGRDCQTYEAGQSYAMPDELAAVFVREGWGTVTPPDVLTTAATTAISPSLPDAPAALPRPRRRRK